MKKLSISFIVAFATALCATNAMAHVGLTNITTPTAFPASTFAVAGTSNQIQFNAGHGCNVGETVPAPPGALDTTRFDITVPAAIVTATGATSVRAVYSGGFGNVVKTTNGDGSITFTWTKTAAASAADDQYYRVTVSMKMPAATTTAITKYQFLATQTCTSGGVDYVMDWGTANSPKLTVFPDKRKGWNQYTLESGTSLTDFETPPLAGQAAKLKSYFGDADVVWVGKAGYSPNTTTNAKIVTLAGQDATYFSLGTSTTPLTTTDVIWVKY